MPKLPLVSSFACVALLSALARAEDQPTYPGAEAPAEEIIQNLSLEGLTAVLTEAGAEGVTPSTEDRVVLFKSGGRNYFVALSACDETKALCSVIAVGRAIKAKLPLEVLNRINEKYNGLIAATRINETSFKMVRTSILGGGVTRSNIAVNLVWYVNETPAFEEFIKSQLVAANTKAKPDVQNVSASLPLGDVVLAPAEISALVEKLHLPDKATPMSGKK